jgi:hypothetical protein
MLGSPFVSVGIGSSVISDIEINEINLLQNAVEA